MMEGESIGPQFQPWLSEGELNHLQGNIWVADGGAGGWASEAFDGMSGEAKARPWIPTFRK